MVKKLFYNDDGDFRPAVAYTIIGVSFLAVGFFVYSAWAKMGSQLESSLLCSTPGCIYSDSRKLEVGEAFPATCPKCGKQSVYPAAKCPKCGHFQIMNQFLGKPGPTQCAKCGTEIKHGG